MPLLRAEHVHVTEAMPLWTINCCVVGDSTSESTELPGTDNVWQGQTAVKMYVLYLQGRMSVAEHPSQLFDNFLICCSLPCSLT